MLSSSFIAVGVTGREWTLCFSFQLARSNFLNIQKDFPFVFDLKKERGLDLFLSVILEDFMLPKRNTGTVSRVTTAEWNLERLLPAKCY